MATWRIIESVTRDRHAGQARAHLKEGGNHEDREDDDTHGLHPLLASRVVVGRLPILGSDDSTRAVDDDGGEEVHGRIDGGGDERHRVGEQDDGDLGAEENKVDEEVDVDGELDFEVEGFFAFG
jgi:hypothetical protein